MAAWRESIGAYANRKILAILLLGFASGLPLLLTMSTLSAWLAKEGISRASIGYFALVGTPYALKFLWSPLIDRLHPPLPLGRRRGWGVTVGIVLMLAVLLLGLCDPTRDLGLMAGLAVAVAFLSASQDIVIDAFRVELLEVDQQGPGAGAAQTGYRLAMLTSGAGALVIADNFGWFASYAAMAFLIGVGVCVFLASTEPAANADAATLERERLVAERIAARSRLPAVLGRLAAWFYGAVVCPFAEFTSRKGWLAILVFVIIYKLGEAMAGIMATPLYIALGFSLTEIAAVSKLFGFTATVAGSLIGGVLVVRLGVMRALLLCGVLQSLGNLFYVLQAGAGHQVPYLALCVAAENLTGGMAGAALVAYISGLCNVAYTATQYALLSSLTAVGRTLFASSAGVLVERMGWAPFFVGTTVITLPALILLCVMMRERKKGIPLS